MEASLLTVFVAVQAVLLMALSIIAVRQAKLTNDLYQQMEGMSSRLTYLHCRLISLQKYVSGLERQAYPTQRRRSGD